MKYHVLFTAAEGERMKVIGLRNIDAERRSQAVELAQANAFDDGDLKKDDDVRAVLVEKADGDEGGMFLFYQIFFDAAESMGFDAVLSLLNALRKGKIVAGPSALGSLFKAISGKCDCPDCTAERGESGVKA